MMRRKNISVIILYYVTQKVKVSPQVQYYFIIIIQFQQGPKIIRFLRRKWLCKGIFSVRNKSKQITSSQSYLVIFVNWTEHQAHSHKKVCRLSNDFTPIIIDKKRRKNIFMHSISCTRFHNHTFLAAET